MALGAVSVISSVAGGGRSIRNTLVVPIGHPFVAGNAVAHGAEGLVPAHASTGSVIGIVERTEPEKITVVYQGEVDLGGANLGLAIEGGNDCFVVGHAYGVSQAGGGRLDRGSHVKPILIATSPKGGIVINTLQEGRQHQRAETPISAPTGAVMAWAGDASRVPAEWMLCDGRAVRKSGTDPIDGNDYSALYHAIGDRYTITAMSVSVEENGSCLVLSLADQGHDECSTSPCHGLMTEDTHRDYRIGWGGAGDCAIGTVTFADPKESVVHFAFRQPCPNAFPREDWSAVSKGVPITIQSLGEGEVDGCKSDRFFVPDMRSRAVFGAGRSVGMRQLYRGEIGGEDAHLLTADEMPSLGGKVCVSDTESFGRDEVMAINAGIISTNDHSSVEVPFMSATKPMNMMPPHVVMNWIICHSSSREMVGMLTPSVFGRQSTDTTHAHGGVFRHEGDTIVLNGMPVPIDLFLRLEPSYSHPVDLVVMSYDGERRHYRTRHQSWTVQGRWSEGDRYLARADEFADILAADRQETAEAFRAVRSARTRAVKDKYPTEGNEDVKLHERDDLNKSGTKGLRSKGKRVSRPRGKHSGGATGGSPE